MGNETQPSYLEYQGRHKGLAGWLLSTDHKRIGLLYLYSIVVFFFVAAFLGLLMRIELIAPGKTIMEPQTYNGLFTIHGIIMIFVIVIPGLAAVFGNFFLPILIGARDVAFPKLNLFSWYLYITGAVLGVMSQFMGSGPPDTGWTFYVPYSVESATSVIWALTAAFILGFSSILTGLNFIVTIHRMRAPGMKWFRMPLFPWALYATAWIQVLATPIVGITLLMVIAERVLNIGFFDPALGGDPVLFQHLFWIYSHPAVYIMILPAMGVVTEIFPTFSQKPVFGYGAIVVSSLAIAFVGYFVWGHHMFTSGMSYYARWFFSFLTFIVAVPSAIKVFNWISTMYGGSIDLKPPLLYAISFIFLFMIGGFTGLVLGSLATNVQTHDTAFVVAHFHYIIFGGMGFAFFAGMHYWYPKMFGKMYNNRVANIAWGFNFVGFNLLYFPHFIIGIQGMPRRSYDYLPQFHTGHFLSTIGAFILIAGLLLMLYNFIRAGRRGEKAPANPWHGVTLEWKIPSPPPHENFDEIPEITSRPYFFGSKEKTNQ
ncbi:MAG: cbb3-type cytochrome c oxidase subunit I [Bacteroidales bacterium]|jgi:cytochrome c oxidase subunit 1|nr:cbb3-type cytochrome c oxidase subunit I [Bacteroidales bacterium]MDX9927596.1 cbb3-type cytochrome c oxidase subunit I [Bacteroidales bacterium]HNX82838.1 cbb3-type cytochrome c oxidase subunit I [Bacteroidales bacterium]HOC47686.1 cbb3-type cytochrome c oxidase subunit I [Bacteroidales bacterium]HPS96595.1 cbb3-type cytochrome c oxidase subunit I [Bacteroidales bacterium]